MDILLLGSFNDDFTTAQFMQVELWDECDSLNLDRNEGCSCFAVCGKNINIHVCEQMKDLLEDW